MFWLMADDIQTRELPPLTQRASFIPSTVDHERRTVELTWTTGAPVLRGYWDRFWEELSLKPEHIRMKRLNNGAPFLRDHAAWSIDATLGVVERAWLLKSEGRALVRFPKAEDDPEADKVFRKVADGILQNISVGYRVYKMEKVADGEDKIPVMRAVDWEPYEISLVPVGADDGAGIRSSPRTAPNAVEVINTRGMAPQKEGNMADEKQAAPAQAEADNETKRAAEMQVERERVATITALARKHDLPADKVDAFIREGATLDTVRSYALDQLAERSNKNGPGQAPSGAPTLTAGDDQRDKRRASEVAWLIERTGFGGMVEQARNKPAFARMFRDAPADPGEARGMTLLEMARDFLERNKVNTRGMTKMEIAGRALSFRGGYQGTDTFPVLFEQALYKVLLASYATQSDTWRLFCGTDTVPDFRPSPRYRTGEMGGTLDRLGENSEFKHKSIPDGARTDISTETRGNIISLTREAIINDDMGALANTASNFGRLAGRSIESDAYALLAQNGGLGPTLGDGKTFFHADRGNVGTGSALSMAGLQADRVLMRKQKDLNGADFIDLRPRTLLLPVELEADANTLNVSEFDPKDNNFRRPNSVRGLFSTIVGSPRMSGTRRYIFADPAGGAVAIKVVFLEGQGEAPVMEMQEGFEVDGTKWKIRSDFKVVPFDPKGAQTNAGG